MRAGAPAGHRGYFHETAFYDSDDEFLATVVPFVQGGVETGEPTLVTLGVTNAELLRSALPDVTGLAFFPGADRYVRPGSAIRDYREMLRVRVEEGATQVRAVGDVPHPGVGAPWSSWSRYEAAANRAFAEFPLWGLCPYDTRSTPPDVLADVRATHPFVATSDGRHLRNDGFVDPRAFLTAVAGDDRDPLEDTPPAIELRDPTPAHARHALGELPREEGLDLEALVLSASEAVTNAVRHGMPPILFRAWSGPGRLVATVADAGPGPDDPFVGLLPPPEDAAGGMGLWIAHQVCDDVSFRRSHGSFEIRLVVGTPYVRT